MTREDFEEKYFDILQDEDVLLADGFDNALIGMCAVSHRAIYDYEKMINILIEDEGMTSTDAIEHLEYNVLGAYVGEMTPIYMF